MVGAVVVAEGVVVASCLLFLLSSGLCSYSFSFYVILEDLSMLTCTLSEQQRTCSSLSNGKELPLAMQVHCQSPLELHNAISTVYKGLWPTCPSRCCPQGRGCI